MPIDLSVHPDRNLAYFRFQGRVNVKECGAIYRTYVNHPRFTPDLTMLTNTGRLEQIDASFLSIVMAVEKLAPTFPLFMKKGISIIHAGSDVAYGMARMMQQIVEPVSRFRFHISRDEEDALSAAGQPFASFNALEAALEDEAEWSQVG